MSDENQIEPDKLQEAQAALDKSRFQLMALKNSAFTTSILFQLQMTFTEQVKSAMVDIEKIQLNPDYFLGLDAKTRLSLLAKLSWHIAYDHPGRYQELEDAFEFKLFAEAADHSVNTMLNSKGYDIPENWSADSKYKDMMVEEIYKYLEKDHTRPPPNDPQFSAGNGDNNDDSNPNPPKLTAEQQKQKQDEMLAKAAMQNDMADADKKEGVGQDILDRVANYHNPKVPWQVLFRNYLYDTVKSDYTYRMPNKFFLPDFYMPSLYSEGITSFGIGIDVSGSISQEEFDDFATESQSMREMLMPEKTEVVQWHHNISSIDELELSQTMDDIEFKETGGTDIHPLLRHWIQNPPKVGVIFTDGYFTPFNKPEEINFPVIWIIHSNDNFKPEFGEVVYYEPDID